MLLVVKMSAVPQRGISKTRDGRYLTCAAGSTAQTQYKEKDDMLRFDAAVVQLEG